MARLGEERRSPRVVLFLAREIPTMTSVDTAMPGTARQTRASNLRYASIV
jgi:hypothetical protein